MWIKLGDEIINMGLVSRISRAGKTVVFENLTPLTNIEWTPKDESEVAALHKTLGVMAPGELASNTPIHEGTLACPPRRRRTEA